MRVMCVNEKWHYASTAPTHEHPQYGDIDVVLREQVVHFTAKEGYILERFPGLCFAKECFVPISDIDETKMERESLMDLINK